MKDFIEKLISRLEVLKTIELNAPCGCDDEETDDDGEQIFEDGRSQGKYEQTNIIIRLVKKLAEEYLADNNVGNNDGWIPVSSGKLPEEPKVTDDVEDMILNGRMKEYNVTIQGAKKATTLYYAGDGYWYDDTTQDYYPVTAWQHLPSAYITPAEQNWQNHMMNRFIRGE